MLESDAFVEEVSVDVEQYIDCIEIEGGCVDGSCVFGQFGGVGKLFCFLFLEPVLQFAVGDGVIHPRRHEMEFHFYVLEWVEIDVVIDDLLGCDEFPNVFDDFVSIAI